MKACLLVATALLAFTLPCRGNAIIAFDQLQVGEDVLSYYDGGFGSLGTGPGPADGAIFSPGWIVGPPDVYGLPSGKSAAISGTAVLNIPAGWSGDTSFYYLGSGGVVSFYDRENGLGALIATLDLPPESNFFPAGEDPRLFQSMVFTMTGPTSIDALTNGGFVVPEPVTLKLLLCGVTVLGLAALGSKHGAQASE
jgi:hypothetical protein